MDEIQRFWQEQAGSIPWFKQWDKVLEWEEPYAQWFKQGLLNASYVCVDQHVIAGRGATVALYWANEQGEAHQWTYQELYDQVNGLASFLRKNGVCRGDVVMLYLPMALESIAMMLACARLGATHSVVFSGFSSTALKDRIEDTKAKFVITADGSYRRGNFMSLKKIVDEAVSNTPTIERVFVVQRYCDQPLSLTARDLIVPRAFGKDIYVEPEKLEATHPLFILYTSGTTGRPKGLVHSTGGYLTYVYATIKWAFDIKQEDVYWCTADIGWITGHSYVAYGPLMHGAGVMIYEGTPSFPDPGAWWKVIQDYKVSIFYTSPTALRMCMKFGDEWPNAYDLSSLKMLGTVGEPINPEVWQWYHTTIGKRRCSVVDTWWQTETGGFMIAPTPGLKTIPLKPGSATLPLPGIDAEVVDAQGNSVPHGTKGFLVINKPWPGMTIGIFGEVERFKEVYWSKFKHRYYSGDYAIRDVDGYFWLLGRADEVLNISGHRIGTAEIESAVVSLPAVAEAATIGVNDEIRGEAIVIFVILKQNIPASPLLKQAVIDVVRASIGKFVQPKEVLFVDKLPKTRSGKIMRRLLRAVLESRDVGDVSTLEDEASVEEIRDCYDQIRQYVQVLL